MRANKAYEHCPTCANEQCHRRNCRREHQPKYGCACTFDHEPVETKRHCYENNKGENNHELP